MVMGSLMLGLSKRKQNDEGFRREKRPRRNSTRRLSFDTRISDTPWSIDRFGNHFTCAVFGLHGNCIPMSCRKSTEQDRDHGGPWMSVVCPFPNRSAVQCMPWAYEAYGWVSLEKNCWVIMEREWQWQNKPIISMNHRWTHRKKTAKYQTTLQMIHLVKTH